MIFVTNFRSNDLNPSKGKQIEFNKGVIDNFFKFSNPEEDAVFECYSLDTPAVITKIKVHFKLSPSRGDYKIYQNADGSDDLKDYFLNTLSLTSANMSDYYAIKRIAKAKYALIYIPKAQLVSNLFAQLTADQLIYMNKGAVNSTIQKIYYGCPGTGKSYKVMTETEGADGKLIVYFDKYGAYVPDINAVADKSEHSTNIFRTTFHPDYDYSTFVGSYKPVMNPVLDEDGNDTGKEDTSSSIKRNF